MNYECISFRREDGVASLTIERPAVLNALNVKTIFELRSACREIAADRTVRVVVLTGTGDRAFAAGADISELAALESPSAGTELAGAGQALTREIEALPIPTIAAVGGYALGGGCELALACDLRIASDRARFGQPEINLGLCPGYGGTQRTAKLLGRGMALYLCLTGETIDAARALAIGLVQRVFPHDTFAAEVSTLARTIAAKPPLAVRAIKRSIVDGGEVPLDAGLTIEAFAFGNLIATADFREGTAAFLEKRPAAFTGR